MSCRCRFFLPEHSGNRVAQRLDHYEGLTSPSVGSVGDAYDNALAETTIGLYKNECIRADSPFRRGPLYTVGDVEYITADYVAWFNQQRLMHRLGRIPPAEAEARYYSELVTGQPAGSQNPEGA